MEAVDFRTNRINKLKELDHMLDVYCGGIESEVEQVKRKTDEEFYFWLDKKIKAAKKAQAEAQKKNAKRGH